MIHANPVNQSPAAPVQMTEESNFKSVLDQFFLANVEKYQEIIKNKSTRTKPVQAQFLLYFPCPFKMIFDLKGCFYDH